jgi:hypothetical protein
MSRIIGASLLVIILFSSAYADNDHTANVQIALPSTPHTAAVRQMPIVSTVEAPASVISYIELDFGPVLPNGSSDRKFVFQGALPGREVGLNVPRIAAVDGAKFFAWVSATNEVTVRFMNGGRSVQNPGGSQVYRIRLK